MYTRSFPPHWRHCVHSKLNVWRRQYHVCCSIRITFSSNCVPGTTVIASLINILKETSLGHSFMRALRLDVSIFSLSVDSSSPNPEYCRQFRSIWRAAEWNQRHGILSILSISIGGRCLRLLEVPLATKKPWVCSLPLYILNRRCYIDTLKRNHGVWDTTLFWSSLRVTPGEHQ